LTQEELLEIISEVQLHRSELDEVEVKSANRGTPQRLYESISALANSIGGGVILFGLDEEKNFEIVGVGDAHRLQEEVSNLASSEMEPSLRPTFTVIEVENKTIV